MEIHYFIIILVIWITGVLMGCCLSKVWKKKWYGKAKSPILKNNRNVDEFAEKVINMVCKGRFINVSTENIFSDKYNIFSEIEVFRRVYRYKELNDIGDEEEITEFRNRMFNVHMTFDSYKLLFRAVNQLNFYSYFCYGNKGNKVFDPQRERLCKRNGSGKNEERKDAYRDYRISNSLPSYLYKYKILRNGKSETLFVNVLDIPGVGFRISAFVISSEYRKMRDEYMEKMKEPTMHQLHISGES